MNQITKIQVLPEEKVYTILPVKIVYETLPEPQWVLHAWNYDADGGYIFPLKNIRWIEGD